jgi:3-oxoacyl-[acyl-carrier protein] reductase
MMPAMDLGIRGRAAIVGGASSGLGAAVADRLAAEGCRLLLWSRDEARLNGVAERLRTEHGAEVAIAAVDAGEEDAAQRLAQAAVDALGSVDICVLNAGGPPTVDPLATESAAWHRALQLLAVTPITLASALIGPMRARRWGRVVALMSWSVKEPIPNLVYSTAGRSALMAWMKTAAPAVAGDGVTLNGVLTGPMATPRMEHLDRERADQDRRTLEEVRADRIKAIPAGRLGDPAELASFVAYLCSEPAAFQTGTFTLIDGGLVRAL